MKISNNIQLTVNKHNILTIVALVTVVVIFGGCNSNLSPEHNNQRQKYSKFLDVNFSKKELSNQDYKTLTKARKRLDKYVVSRNGKFYMKINSGKSVNISARVFNHFSKAMHRTNLKISEGKLILLKNGMVIKNKKLTNIAGVARVKTSSIEGNKFYYYKGDPENWGIGVAYHWYGTSIILSDNATETIIAGAAVGGSNGSRPYSK